MALLDLPDDYTLDHLRGALKHVTQFRVAVDGGAHRGIWTRELAQHFKLVIAFEPREELALKIPCGFVRQVALGEKRGQCAMRDGPKNTGQGHVVDGDDVPMITLDECQIEELDFIKFDLEGYELPALRGAERTISIWRPAIMVEQNGLCERYGYKEGDLVRWLRKHGYRHVDCWGVDHLYVHACGSRLQHH